MIPEKMSFMKIGTMDRARLGLISVLGPNGLKLALWPQTPRARYSIRCVEFLDPTYDSLYK